MYKCVASLVRFLLAFALMLCAAPAAWAHAELEKSEPAAGARLTSAPEEVRLSFSQAIAAGTTAKVLDANGTQVNTQAGMIDLNDLDRKTFVVPLPSMPPGTYTVEWTSVSEQDGDSESGTFTFTIAAAAQPTIGATQSPVATPAAQPTASTQTLPQTGDPHSRRYEWLLVAAFVLAAGAAVRRMVKQR